MSADFRMTYLRTGYSAPGYSADDGSADYTMVNDSFGTVDLADSTGLDEEMETGDAKACNFPTRED
jgi:hypothetical protein